MPFLKFARDKRGYEHFYLVHSTTRRGKSRSRILYWFRSPPGVKIGRPPFDDSMRRALEAQYPEIAFDWQQLIDTPIPPPAPDVERWRERRRVERAAKQAAAAETAAEIEEPASETGDPSEILGPQADFGPDSGGEVTPRPTDGARHVTDPTASAGRDDQSPGVL